MKLRVYADTSVIGGCEDDEFAEYSLRLMDWFALGQLTLVVSELVMQELENAPMTVRDRFAILPKETVEIVPLSPDTIELADQYIAAGALAISMRADARHIAAATIARVDVLVSWNFKHIVNLQRIRWYNSVNLRLGYPLIEIRTPRELLSDEHNKEEI